jgi:hypothetical protein
LAGGPSGLRLSMLLLQNFGQPFFQPKQTPGMWFRIWTRVVLARDKSWNAREFSKQCSVQFRYRSFARRTEQGTVDYRVSTESRVITRACGLFRRIFSHNCQILKISRMKSNMKQILPWATPFSKGSGSTYARSNSSQKQLPYETHNCFKKGARSLAFCGKWHRHE